MSDLDEKRLAAVERQIANWGLRNTTMLAADILRAIDAFDAADAREAVTEEALTELLTRYYAVPARCIPDEWRQDMRAALEHAAPLLARRARAPMPVRVTLPMIEAAYHEFMGWSHIHRDMNAMERAIEAALAAAPRDPQQPVQRHMTLGEQRTAMNALRRAGRPAEHVGIGMTDKSEPWHADLATRVKLAVLRGGEAHYVTRRRASAPPAALREVASTARTLARQSPANPALAKFAEAVARWAGGAAMTRASKALLFIQGVAFGSCVMITMIAFAYGDLALACIALVIAALNAVFALGGP